MTMIQIGRYRFGLAQASMIIVFVVLSICAAVAAFNQARPEYPVPLGDLLLINECMALAVTLVYGIVAHFAVAIIDRLRRK